MRAIPPILAAILLMSFAASAVAAIDEDETPIAVQVKKVDELVTVDAQFTVAVSQQLAWDVLTDFEHMARFISNVKSSRVTSINGDKLQVEQKGVANHGPLSFSFESVREIELKPIEKISSRILSGSMKKLDGITLLMADGAGTRVVYHADSIPNSYVPPIIGPKFIENESRHQFEEMRTEMLKRKRARTQ